jgi:hypothetical protein
MTNGASTGRRRKKWGRKTRGVRKNRGKTTAKKRKKTSERVTKTMPSKLCEFHCGHEKCHHIKFIKYLEWQRTNHNIHYFASLLPYNNIYHPKKYGIINGMPDFFIVHPLRDKETGEILKTSLYIELKVGGGRLTPDEKTEIKKIIKKGDSMVGVCYGVNACKDLMKSYRDNEDLAKLEVMCWAGKTKKPK